MQTILSVFLLLFSVVGQAAPPRTVMVHLFEWKWADIARECEEYLGPNGFAAIQVSPPNEHAVVAGYPWYQRYQPVSYKIESRSGSREEFAAMVKTCRNAGVDIYVDAVINHMTGVLPEGQTQRGIAGTPYSRYGYSNYSYSDFHHCGRNQDDDIRDYSNRWEVQNCELANLADLNTAALKVQRTIAGYLNDLVDLGVAGFRIDAAKHMASEDLAGILAEVHGSPYVYQEVIGQKTEPIQLAEYFSNGDVTEFQYGLDVSRVFREGKIAWFNGQQQLGKDWGYIPSDKAVVFIDNHDNQRGHGGGGLVLTHKEANLYELANVFMLAWPYGYPQIMSSYRFSSPEQGPPSNDDKTESVFMSGQSGCIGRELVATGGRGWVCEHRWPTIAAMVEFRNVTSGAFSINRWWSDGDNVIAFARGKKGFVVINNSASIVEREFESDMPPGRYCNVVEGIQKGVCKGSLVTVGNDGRFHGLVRPGKALAIHVGRKVI